MRQSGDIGIAESVDDFHYFFDQSYAETIHYYCNGWCITPSRITPPPSCIIPLFCCNCKMPSYITPGGGGGYTRDMMVSSMVTVQYKISNYGTVLYDTLLYNTVQNGTVQYKSWYDTAGNVQYCTVP